jgi:hypothetical protein
MKGDEMIELLLVAVVVASYKLVDYFVPRMR